MHRISNERALEHWRTLSMPPSDKLDLLGVRFANEQPLLAQAIAQLSSPVGSTEESVPLDELRAGSDPDWEPFERFGTLLVRGACLAELFRREAGHALRRLEEVQINSILRANMQIVDALSKQSLSSRSFLTTSAQPELLQGVVTGHLSVEGVSPGEATAVVLYRILVDALDCASGDASPVPSGDWDAERILVALSVRGDPLRRQALNAAESFRAELKPQFVEHLDWCAAEPEEALGEDGSLLTHALFLLAKWREDSAWPACRKLISVPSDIIHDLLGDLITEAGPVLLATLGRSRRDELRAMIKAEKVDEYSRAACIGALTTLVAWEEMPREELVSGLRELLTSKLRTVPENEIVFAAVVSAAYDFEAWELLPEVEAAYQRGAVDEAFMDLESFQEAAAEKRRGLWQEFCQRHQPIGDVAAATSWLDEFPLPDNLSLGEEPLREDPNLIAHSAEPYIAPPKVGRNEPCPCGSGKKYKKCCGK